MTNLFIIASIFCADNLLPILIGLLGAAGLGYLLKHFMGGSTSASKEKEDWKAKYEQSQAQLQAERNKKAAKADKKKEQSFATAAPTRDTAELDQLQNRIKNLNGEINSLKNDKSALEGQVNSAEAKAKESKSLQSEIETMKTRIDGLVKALDSSKAEAEKYKSDFEFANSERSKLSASLSTSDIGDMQKKIAKLETDLDNSRMAMATVQGQLNAAQNNKKTVGDLLDRTYSSASDSPELKEAINKIASMETEAKKKEEEYARMQKEVELNKLAITAAVNQANEKNNAEILDLRDKTKYLEAKISRLEDEKLKLASNSGVSKISLESLPQTPTQESKTSNQVPVTETKAIENIEPINQAIPEVTSSTENSQSETNEVSSEKEVKNPTPSESIPQDTIKSEDPVEEPEVLSSSQEDDLTKIEGVGPKIAETLKNGGIKTFAQLASASPEEIKSQLSEAGGIIAQANPGTWPEQAALLRDGKMEEFNALTQELVAGVRYSEAADDLKVVEGIGPVLEKVLNAGGVFTYAKMVELGSEGLKKILVDSGDNVHDPSTWAEQAALLKAGKMEEFQKLIDELKNGRRS
jgi:predicted flap endonuclease-1-like 5' DNA nuclease